MTGLRGFEAEKDIGKEKLLNHLMSVFLKIDIVSIKACLAMYTMDKYNEKFSYNIDFQTSTWFGDTMAPWGKQRKLSQLLLGERLLKSSTDEFFFNGIRLNRKTAKQFFKTV